MPKRPSEQSNPAAVRRILAEARETRLLAEREARDSYRRVSLLDDRYVLKEFVYGQGARPARRPWRREHAALTHLADPTLPASVGYLSEATDGEWRVRYLRGYVPGTALVGFDAASAAEAGVLLAGLHARGGIDDRQRGRAWGAARENDYLAQAYHRPGDEYSSDWDLSGAAEDAQLYLDVARRLAGEKHFPAWSADSEFRAIRAATDAARAAGEGAPSGAR